jgi:hypothetical protein
MRRRNPSVDLSELLYGNRTRLDEKAKTVSLDKAKTRDAEVLREFLFKEVEIAQDIISRMGTNSFLIKGWSITLVVATLLLGGGAAYYNYVALLPWLLFWSLDAYFLRTERLYRKLYDWLIENREAKTNQEHLLEMNKAKLEKRFGREMPCLVQVMFSRTLIAFHGLLLIMIVALILVNPLFPA